MKIKGGEGETWVHGVHREDLKDCRMSRSPERSFLCQTEWYQGWWSVYEQDRLRTTSAYLASRRAYVLLSWALKSSVSWYACPLLA